MHIGAKLAQLAHAHPDRAAIVDDAGTLVVPRSSTQRMHALRQCDARPRPRERRPRRAAAARHAANISRPTTAPWPPASCACRSIRGSRGSELVALLRFAGARALVTHPAFAEKVERLTDDVESLQSIVCVGEGPGPRLRSPAGKIVRPAAAGGRRRRPRDAEFQRRHHRRAQGRDAAASQSHDGGARTPSAASTSRATRCS